MGTAWRSPLCARPRTGHPGYRTDQTRRRGASTIVIVEAAFAYEAQKLAEKLAWNEGEDLLDNIMVEASSIERVDEDETEDSHRAV